MLKDIQAEQLTGVVYSAKDAGDYVFFHKIYLWHYTSHIEKEHK